MDWIDYQLISRIIANKMIMALALILSCIYLVFAVLLGVVMVVMPLKSKLGQIVALMLVLVVSISITFILFRITSATIKQDMAKQKDMAVFGGMKYLW
jgi:acyl-CoA synthetase (AMP-forming)/AMP-acid ligase II